MEAELPWSCEIVRNGPVAWVLIGNVQQSVDDGFEGKCLGIRPSIDRALNELRFDGAVRVIGLTGVENGEFYSMGRRSRYDDDPRWRERFDFSRASRSRRAPPGPKIGVASGIESLILTEKPVIARVNGDAIGWGQSLLWACDLIVAMEWAVISDIHMGQGEVIDHRGERRGMPFAVSPGDGAISFLPLYLSLSPALAKEYQLLSRAWTAREFYDKGAINYIADSYEDLDAKVDELIDALLRRPQFALNRTKKIVQKAIIEQWNQVQDLASAYEGRDFVDHLLAGNTAKRDWWPQQDAPERPSDGWSPDTGRS